MLNMLAQLLKYAFCQVIIKTRRRVMDNGFFFLTYWGLFQLMQISRQQLFVKQ